MSFADSLADTKKSLTHTSEKELYDIKKEL